MTLEAFQPENELERLVLAAKQRQSSHSELLAAIAAADIYVSSKTEVQRDGHGFAPIVVEHEGRPLVAAFSGAERPLISGDVARFILRMNGGEFIKRLPPGYGLALNPGYAAQVFLAPGTVAELKAKLKN